ncbi:HlyD family efflux transporter periplasmic adaptor subunit [Avibacterium sp. 21-599]|uniref:HlyD family efflux transporter periplasmic adaptor subunit n=1 Tax=Avibacterium sp. 21-599 TaxID=2911528 RepID=UPI002246DC16|nr:HlyD family efflux transporter periplasmic adaptor subunit [Avibacterium sp. 21-599]MCW9718453.1 HlyD family efflux transporter periplasmic adaptor subunit [Avibacterium sp. 21-599]
MRDLTQEMTQPTQTKRYLTLISLLLTALLIWSYITPFSRVVRANGELVSAARTQVVQNLEGGIIQAINVEEGQIVKKGQVLLHFDTTRFQSAVEELDKKLASLTFKRQRLQQELKLPLTPETQIIPLRFPEKLAQLYPTMAEAEQALYQTRLQEFMSKAKHFQRLIALKEQQLNNIKPFIKSGAVSKQELLTTEQQLAALYSERDAFFSDVRKRQSTELSETISEQSLLEEKRKANLDQLERTTVKAPADGTVNQLFFSTVGAVVSPGQPILDIVPKDDSLVAEVRVLPKDIGYVVPNMNANLKLTAYDYSIYGTLQGKVTKIGADTVPDKHRRDAPPSYVVTITLTPESLQKWQQRHLDIRNGMVVDAELEANKMRIIDYLLRPILKTRDALKTI